MPFSNWNFNVLIDYTGTDYSTLRVAGHNFSKDTLAEPSQALIPPLVSARDGQGTVKIEKILESLLKNSNCQMVVKIICFHFTIFKTNNFFTFVPPNFSLMAECCVVIT